MSTCNAIRAALYGATRGGQVRSGRLSAAASAHPAIQPIDPRGLGFVALSTLATNSHRTSHDAARADLIAEADALLRELFPICRSLTGDGVRQTFDILKRVVPIDTHEIASGTTCFDWTVPDEWNIRNAWVKDETGRKVIDFQRSNLHVVGYSEPVDAVMSYNDLRPRLHTLPDRPTAVPYRTSYYKRDWGFCLTQRKLETLNRAARYHVYIDSTLEPGSLTYADMVVPGRATRAHAESGASDARQYLISTYCCHPSMVNDNLSGVVLATLLARELQRRGTRHMYRFVFVPETIGAIVYLHEHADAMRQLDGGFVITTVAGRGDIGYKPTFLGDHAIDRAVRLTFAERGVHAIDYPFDINGSDERQYSQPAWRIPVGTICKDKYFEYDEYHTSMDDLTFATAEQLVVTLELYLGAIEKLEQDDTYRSLCPQCEPMLGKRGLYPSLGGAILQPASSLGASHQQRVYGLREPVTVRGDELDALRWVMFYSDGSHSLTDIVEKTGLPMTQLHDAARVLCEHGLLEVVGDTEV